MTFRYIRRKTTPCHVGKQCIGGNAPILLQSMANVDTNDSSAAIAQATRIADAGGELVRFTAQGVREAKALTAIRQGLDSCGYSHLPLSADIHFNARAAYEAAYSVEKIRINPGNFYDPAKRFATIEYTDEAYAAEVVALQSDFATFVSHCRTLHRAIRIGVNHGSLSDRIMSRYGDTPRGMVASCMEFLEVCHAEAFDDVVISIKASNPLVMVETVQLLVQEMDTAGMHYPIHLGVTEAGHGEDGRIKSAVGIGALLSMGIGDTIRVSLSEEPEAEIPVCKLLRSYAEALEQAPAIEVEQPMLSAPVRFHAAPTVWLSDDGSLDALEGEERPDYLLQRHYLSATDPSGQTIILHHITDQEALQTTQWQIPSQHMLAIEITHPNVPDMLRALDSIIPIPYLIALTSDAPAEELPTRWGFELGDALLRGQGAGLLLRADSTDSATISRIAYGLLQASRRRITRTEYISCPSCGRTLFDLQTTVEEIKRATAHLKGLKIGVMGCIVNGPGEMADADYGYVGSSPGHIDLYKRREKVKRNVPQEQAVEQLIELIKENGDWHDA